MLIDIAGRLRNMKSISDDIKTEVFTHPTLTEIEASTVLAKEASVQAIPTNPLLDDDSRLDYLDASVSSRSTFDSSTDKVTVSTNEDKTGYSLTSAYDRAKDALSYTEYTAPDNTSVSAIKAQTDKMNFSGTDIKATLDGETVTASSVTDKTGYSLASTERVKLDASQPDYAPAKAGDEMSLTASAISAIWSATTRTLTSFGTLISDVWNYVTRTLTDKTNFSLTSAYDSAKTASSQTSVDAITSILQNESYGLSALKNLIDAIDTSTELQARFDEIKGSGWTNETLKAIKDSITNNNISTQDIRDAMKLAPTAGDPEVGSIDAYLEDITSKSTVIQNSLTGAIANGTIERRTIIKDTQVIEIVRGDASPITFNFGSKESWVNKKVYFIAKKSKTMSNSEAIVNREITITDETNRVGVITLSSTETNSSGTYYCEVETRDLNDENPRTDYQGILKIIQDIRQ